MATVNERQPKRVKTSEDEAKGYEICKEEKETAQEQKPLNAETCHEQKPVAEEQEDSGSDLEPTDEEIDEYDKAYIESEGFDVPSKIGRKLLGGVVEVGSNSVHFGDSLIKGSKAALELYNSEHKPASFQFVDVVKANVGVVAGLMYYITFRALSSDDHTYHTFQAKVWSKIDFTVEVEMCRKI